MRAFNSTIKIKNKPCKSCGKIGPLFSRGRCQQCARIEDNKDEPEELDGESLAYLINDLDTLCSLIVRMSAADSEGFVRCYTCSTRLEWQKCDAGHYIGRKNMFLRWDIERNIKVQCVSCNRHKHGNLAEYGKRLEKEKPGITEILLEESHIVQKLDRDELRAMSVEFNKRLTVLKNK